MLRNCLGRVAVALVLLLISLPAGAEDFDLSWHRIASGGETFSTGGAYSLGGTIGQHEAGTAAGGPYSLSGGFWTDGGVASVPYICDSTATPVDGGRVQLTVTVCGDCSLVDYVIFDVIPGDDCDTAYSVWSKWAPSNGDCEVSIYPIVQPSWDDGSGIYTVAARLYRQGELTEPECIQVPIDEGPCIDVLTASPDPVTIGERVTLTAAIGCDCPGADYVVFYVIPGDNCDITDRVWFNWVPTNGECEVSTYPKAQASWDDGSGSYTVAARTYWVDGSGGHFSDTVCVQAGMGETYIAGLTASPDPVEVGERVALTANLGGDCAQAQYVVFYVVPGTDCEITHEVWYKWVPTNGECEVSTYPIVQSSWDDGSGIYSVVARVAWAGGSGWQFTDTYCIQSGIVGADPEIADLTAAPDPVEVGERVTLTANLGGDCAQAQYVVFYVVPGTDCEITHEVWYKWVPTSGECEVSTYPIVQSSWDDGSGIYSVVARAAWSGGSGWEFSDQMCIQAALSSSEPCIDALVAFPDPVEIGDRVMFVASICGPCTDADWVAFYVMPGVDCDITHQVWTQWVATNGHCSVATYPIVQPYWHDGSGVYTVAARALWNDGGMQFSDTFCIQASITGRSASAVLHVDGSAAPGGDGSTWASAIPDLQKALDLARDPGRQVAEIWVAEGTYRPAPEWGERSRSFDLPEGVALYGGFAGVEVERKERDPSRHLTVLSGDLNGDDATLDSRLDNSYHVLRADGVGPGTRLDGFVIRGGAADAAGEDASGAGLFARDASLLVNRCVFESNLAQVSGGGIEFAGASYPWIVNCEFRDNHSWSGGAVATSHSVHVTLANSLFAGNRAGDAGGAISLGGDAALTNCTFVGNTATGLGGGVYAAGSSADVVTVANSIFWSNSDAFGYMETSQLCIVSGQLTINNSCVEGWTGLYAGVGNFGNDPGFIDSSGPDGLPSSGDEDYRLLGNSPCIDTGDVTLLPLDVPDLDEDGDVEEDLPLDVDRQPRSCDGNGDLIKQPDLGPYEQECGEVPTSCAGDIDGSLSVDQADLGLLLAVYGAEAGDQQYDPRADINSDGFIGPDDMALLLDAYGKPCEVGG